jgi:hypothetical protein
MRILYNELKALVKALNENGIDYALCGGMALAIYGIPRGTIDIDVIILSEDVETAVNIAKKLGYQMDAGILRFSDGDIVIRRVTKLLPEFNDFITFDMLMVTDKIQPAWEKREEINWEHGIIKVLSREGLIELKKISGRDQDLVDIKNLEGAGDES